METADFFRQPPSSVARAMDDKAVRESSLESDSHSPRIAHTLTACTRCRKRKTRCDPSLPRCLPCERAGAATCEYWDTAKGRNIPRTYVIKLQDKVRELEAELAQYTEEDGTQPNTEDMVRPGGLVRLHQDDETPRFLGPSSGIAMTRIVMEEAKMYTDSRSIRELVPEIRERRAPVQSPDTATDRKKSYPIISAVPAPAPPSRLVTDKLVEVFNQKAQHMLPTLHEPTLAKNVQDVYDGDTDAYKNFVVRMVVAISIHKLDSQYAGLADSYYLAAMAYLEAVIRPKDIRTLQCLVLISQYSMLTPTRTAIYYVVGLATRLSQQLGLTEEKTITQGLSVDPLELDMRRRLFWICLSMEFGLSHSMGRPNSFASGQDHLDVGFFAEVDDEYITSNGILLGPPSEKKLVAIHFFRMRLLQAEIRRVLYQRKRAEPKDTNHPWYSGMTRRMEEWKDMAPGSSNWKTWFIGRHNTMLVFLHRPSPQVPIPSAHSAIICYDAATSNVKLQRQQMEIGSADITWAFLLALFMAINTILWAISYTEVRSLHPKDEVEACIGIALDIITKCQERWPGTGAASHLYEKLSKACLKSYDARYCSDPPSSFCMGSPSSLSTDTESPSTSESSATTASLGPVTDQIQQMPPTFTSVFNSKPEPVEDYNQSGGFAQPCFRSNSIFSRPSNGQSDRRFSYFPPDFTQPQALNTSWNTNTTPAPPPPQVQFPTAQMQSLPLITNPSYLMQSQQPYLPYQMYSSQSYDMGMRQGSLSQEQQVELMQTLETDGVTEIDNFINAPASLYNRFIKYER